MKQKRYDLIFKRWKKQYKFFNRYKQFAQNKNKVKSTNEIKSYIGFLLEKEKDKKKKYKQLRIKYDYPGYQQIIKKYKEKLTLREGNI